MVFISVIVSDHVIQGLSFSIFVDIAHFLQKSGSKLLPFLIRQGFIGWQRQNKMSGCILGNVFTYALSDFVELGKFLGHALNILACQVAIYGLGSFLCLSFFIMSDIF